jgi:hypothetical protein
MIKQWLKYKIFYRWFSREEIFRDMFCPTDQVAIINALWRRSKDDTDKGTPVERRNEEIKSDCARLAKQLSEYQ